MPQRLVYAPRAYVYTKKSDGTILDLSNYVTAGEVDRKVSQVSTATVTLRNTQRQFTKPASGAAFHPQDPITIYLERIANRPVRVFTGYLDETPYYQMYPGTITLNASCTLKRLLYSYFDPSLPYVIAFFEKYGWINTGSGSLISSQAFDSQQTNTQAAVNAGSKPINLQDGSLGKLLWAVLFNMAQWDDTNIYIESLPSGTNGIAARMATLMQSLQQEEQQASQEFTTFLEAVVGTSSQGSGGGAGASTGTAGGGSINSSMLTSGQNTFASTVSQLTGLDANVVAAWLLSEESGSAAAERQAANNNDWLNIGYTDSGTFGSSDNIWSDPTTAATATAGWLQGRNTIPGYGPASAGVQAILNTAGESPQAQITALQNSGWASSHYPSLPSIYASVVASGGATSGGDTTSTTTGNNPRGVAIENNSGSAPDGTSVNSATATANSTVSRTQAMLDAAQAITNGDYPYAFGGGHPSAGTPSSGSASESGGAIVTGFDCSGAVGAVLASASAGITQGASVGADNSIISTLVSQGLITPGQGSGNPEVTLWDLPTVHIFMSINGRYFGTSDGNNGNASQKNGGAGWLDDGHPDTQTYTPYHYTTNYLNQTVKYKPPNVTGSGPNAPSAGAGGTGSAGGSSSASTSAQAFVSELEFPSVEDQITAIALGAEGKGLMHDQSLMPFVQQLTQACLRSFMSLPNGDFYAFYPDYFGEMGTHQPYWLIDDIEILDGGISLSDAGLATHVFAIGDNTWPRNNELLNMLFSAGTITVYNAFLGNLVDTQPGAAGVSSSGKKTKKQNKNSPATTAEANPGSNLSGDIMTADEAAKFVERYGARPLVQNYPMVRSAIYEMLLAYQQFMMAWSSQFQTPFSFTFMPEVFPGGKVAFPNHGLQMYVEEVVHSWDYSEGGFTTTATLSAPSVYGTSNPDLPPNMIDALVEPLRQLPPGPTGSKDSADAANADGVTKQKQKQIEQLNAAKSKNLKP